MVRRKGLGRTWSSINHISNRIWRLCFWFPFGVCWDPLRLVYLDSLLCPLEAWQRRLKLGHLVVSVFVGLIMTVVVYFAIVYVFDLAFGSAADRVSNSMRATMYEQSLRVIWGSAAFWVWSWIGSFKVGIMTASGQLTVDSRVVSLMIDSGFSALFLYLALVSATLLVSLRNAALSSEREGRIDRYRVFHLWVCAVFLDFVP